MIARRVPLARSPLKRSSKPLPLSSKQGTRTPARRKKRKSLSKQADALWSKLVKLPGHCDICLMPSRLQAAHGFSRRYRGTRWLPINGFCLCSGCHLTMTYDPIAWDDYLRTAWGLAVYADLRALALKKATPDFPSIIAALTAELKERS